MDDWYDESSGDVLGYDVLGNVVRVLPGRGAAPRPMARPGRPPLNLPRGMLPGGPAYRGGPQPLGAPLQGPPQWRAPQLAPGVMAPFEGLVQLPLAPSLNAGVFTAAFPLIEFAAQPQKPFRGQRIVALVARSAGAASVQPRISGGIFVGTDLQGASFGDAPLEVYAQLAFGVELVMTPAGPGINIRVPVSTAATPVPGGETVAVSIVILGRYIAG